MIENDKSATDFLIPASFKRNDTAELTSNFVERFGLLSERLRHTLYGRSTDGETDIDQKLISLRQRLSKLQQSLERKENDDYASLISTHFDQAHVKTSSITTQTENYAKALQWLQNYSTFSGKLRFYEGADSFVSVADTEKLLFSLRNEDFEFGMNSRTELIVEELLAINKLKTRNWLNEIYVRHFGDIKILSGILHVISRFEAGDMNPQGTTMALAGLSHKSDEIKELSVRALEHWGGVESLNVLRNVNVETLWLQNYINQVLDDLSLEHGISSTQILTS